MNRGDYRVLPLAVAGGVAGVYEYYVKPELTAARMWAAIGLGVMAYELAAPQGELLSEGCDRALATAPVLTRLGIGYTALHLMNLMPEKLDLFHRLAHLK